MYTNSITVEFKLETMIDGVNVSKLLLSKRRINVLTLNFDKNLYIRISKAITKSRISM